jgi:hypothetical protein
MEFLTKKWDEEAMTTPGSGSGLQHQEQQRQLQLLRKLQIENSFARCLCSVIQRPKFGQYTSVTDPDHFDADPDPTSEKPGCGPVADPDPIMLYIKFCNRIFLL